MFPIKCDFRATTEVFDWLPVSNNIVYVSKTVCDCALIYLFLPHRPPTDVTTWVGEVWVEAYSRVQLTGSN